jgi:hypothetical protein
VALKDGSFSRPQQWKEPAIGHGHMPANGNRQPSYPSGLWPDRLSVGDPGRTLLQLAAHIAGSPGICTELAIVSGYSSPFDRLPSMCAVTIQLYPADAFHTISALFEHFRRVPKALKTETPFCRMICANCRPRKELLSAQRVLISRLLAHGYLWIPIIPCSVSAYNESRSGSPTVRPHTPNPWRP